MHDFAIYLNSDDFGVRIFKKEGNIARARKVFVHVSIIIENKI